MRAPSTLLRQLTRRPNDAELHLELIESFRASYPTHDMPELARAQNILRRLLSLRRQRGLNLTDSAQRIAIIDELHKIAHDWDIDGDVVDEQDAIYEADEMFLRLQIASILDVRLMRALCSNLPDFYRIAAMVPQIRTADLCSWISLLNRLLRTGHTIREIGWAVHDVLERKSDASATA